jgi:hypothetical protein
MRFRIPGWVVLALFVAVLFLGAVLLKPELKAYFFQPHKWPQERAKVTLRMIANLQRTFYERESRYAMGFEELNWHLPFDGVYNYYLNDNSLLDDVKVPVSIHTARGRDVFYAVAAGNRDDDEVLDIWLIDNSGRLIHLTDDDVD